MVSTVPSAWLTMENALARLARDFTILTILPLVLVVVSLLSWFRTGVWISGLSSQSRSSSPSATWIRSVAERWSGCVS